jgi:hypothetical protein
VLLLLLLLPDTACGVADPEAATTAAGDRCQLLLLLLPPLLTFALLNCCGASPLRMELDVPWLPAAPAAAAALLLLLLLSCSLSSFMLADLLRWATCSCRRMTSCKWVPARKPSPVS